MRDGTGTGSGKGEVKGDARKGEGMAVAQKQIAKHREPRHPCTKVRLVRLCASKLAAR